MIYGRNPYDDLDYDDLNGDEIDCSGEYPDTPEYNGEEWDRYEGEREKWLASVFARNVLLFI